MAAPIQYPLVNGVRHSFASIEAIIANLPYQGFTSIEYSRERDRAYLDGNHTDPYAKTRGTNKYEGEIEMYLAEWSSLQQALQAAAAVQGIAYGDYLFDVVVSYGENGFPSIVDTIKGCSMDSTKASNKKGADPSARTFKLNPIKILFNGIDDVSTPLISVAQSLASSGLLTTG